MDWSIRYIRAEQFSWEIARNVADLRAGGTPRFRPRAVYTPTGLLNFNVFHNFTGIGIRQEQAKTFSEKEKKLLSERAEKKVSLPLSFAQHGGSRVTVPFSTNGFPAVFHRAQWHQRYKTIEECICIEQEKKNNES